MRGDKPFGSSARNRDVGVTDISHGSIGALPDNRQEWIGRFGGRSRACAPLGPKRTCPWSTATVMSATLAVGASLTRARSVNYNEPNKSPESRFGNDVSKEPVKAVPKQT